MTIKTLAFIQSLLECEAEARKNTQTLLWKAFLSAEDSGSDNAACLRQEYDAARGEYCDALDALRDFTEHEWS